jgi:hypothetical protein
MIELHLRQEDTKLVYLAVAYHLGRPGSELDPVTKQLVEHGLAEVARALQPQLGLATATINLSADQITKLGSGMYGSITELKAELQSDAGGGRKSSVPGFDRTLRHLFPEVDEDVDSALDIAERMIMLKRRLDGEFAKEPPEAIQDLQPRKRGWWPFGR